MDDPLQAIIRKLEQIRDACYVCDRVPLDDMISDLRRWAKELAPDGEGEVPTVRERPAAAKQQQLKARTG